MLLGLRRSFMLNKEGCASSTNSNAATFFRAPRPLNPTVSSTVSPTVKNAKVDENGITAQGQSIKSFSMAKRVCEAPTIEELAKKVGMDPLVLAKRLRSGITSAVRP